MSEQDGFEHVSGPVGRVVEQVTERRNEAIERGEIPGDPVSTPVLADDSPQSFLQAMVQMASNPGIDLDRMDRLMAMHQQMETKQGEREFDEALSRAQANVGAIVKNQTNRQTSSKYADLHAVNKAVMPVLTSEGFSVSFDEGEAPEGFVKVMGTLSRSGISRGYTKILPVDGAGIKGNSNKIPIHAHQSAVTYAKRYLVLDMVNIAATDDDDGNAAGAGPVINAEEVAQIRALIKQVGADEKRLCVYLRISKIEDLQVSQWGLAMTAIEAKGSEQKASENA